MTAQMPAPEVAPVRLTEPLTSVEALRLLLGEVYLHCGRSLLRSGLWNAATWPHREALPSAAQIFADHMAEPDLTCEAMETVLDKAYHELY